MSRIPQGFIDDLLAKADIVDVIDEYVPLKKAGSNFKALCPFHEERTPSFNVNPDRQIYHCFGCGAGGTAIGFLMDYAQLRFPEAVRELADRLGLEVPVEGGGAESSQAESNAAGPDLGALRDLNEKAARYYEYQLRRHPEAQQVHEYLRGRGISGETAARFRLGFAPEGWRNLLGAFGGDNATREQLVEAGLVVSRENAPPYDRFRGRLMFPIRDRRGRVVAFGGRVLGDGEPKYLNSPEGPLFHKGRELYGFYEARQALRRENRALVVEGYMDVVGLAENGVDYAVAPLGTALTRDQLQLVLRAVPEVVLAFDGDEAGRDAAWRSVDTALPELSKGHLIRFLFLPEGEDPDSLVQREGGDAFRARQDQATPLLDFLLDGLQQRVDLSHTDGRARLVELARPYFAKLPEGPLRTLYVQRLAGPTGLRAEDLSRELSRGEGGGSRRQEAAKSGTPARSSAGPVAGRARRSVVRQALILLLANPYELAEDTLAYREDLLASDEAGVNLLVRVAEQAQAHPDMPVAAIVESLRDEPYGDALARLAGADPEVLPEDQRTEFKGCLRRLRSRAIQARIDHLLAEAQAGRLPNEQLSEIHELKRQREALDRPSP